jgi:Na+/H+ antiporter NhaA
MKQKIYTFLESDSIGGILLIFATLLALLLANSPFSDIYKIASMPRDSSWLMLYGVSVLTGIGFTMSLFVDSLAFVDDRLFAYADKLAILFGTLMSAVLGYIILKFAILQKEYNEKKSL